MYFVGSNKLLYEGIITDYPPVVQPEFNLFTRGFIFDTLLIWGYFRLVFVTHLC